MRGIYNRGSRTLKYEVMLRIRMKKQKTIKEFFFTEDNVLRELNTTLPIKLRYLEGLIERVYKRYPLLNKSEVAVIVKAAFEALRELLVSGCVLNFNKFVFDMKLHFFGDMLHPSVKVKLTTPPGIRIQNGHQDT